MRPTLILGSALLCSLAPSLAAQSARSSRLDPELRDELRQLIREEVRRAVLDTIHEVHGDLARQHPPVEGLPALRVARIGQGGALRANIARAVHEFVDGKNAERTRVLRVREDDEATESTEAPGHDERSSGRVTKSIALPGGAKIKVWVGGDDDDVKDVKVQVETDDPHAGAHGKPGVMILRKAKDDDDDDHAGAHGKPGVMILRKAKDDDDHAGLTLVGEDGAFLTIGGTLQLGADDVSAPPMAAVIVGNAEGEPCCEVKEGEAPACCAECEGGEGACCEGTAGGEQVLHFVTTDGDAVSLIHPETGLRIELPTGNAPVLLPGGGHWVEVRGVDPMPPVPATPKPERPVRRLHL